MEKNFKLAKYEAMDLIRGYFKQIENQAKYSNSYNQTEIRNLCSSIICLIERIRTILDFADEF